MAESLDELLNQLKQSTIAPVLSAAEENNPKVDITDENINKYVVDIAQKLVDSGLTTVEALRQNVIGTEDAEYISAYSSMYKSVVDAVETINKINIQNKKVKAAKELKAIDVAAKKQLPEGKTTTNNITILATREEIFKKFIEQKDSKSNSIDADFTEEQNEDK